MGISCTSPAGESDPPALALLTSTDITAPNIKVHLRTSLPVTELFLTAFGNLPPVSFHPRGLGLLAPKTPESPVLLPRDGPSSPEKCPNSPAAVKPSQQV